MPRKMIPYPAVESLSLSVDGSVTEFTQEHFKKIFRKTDFVEKVRAFKSEKNIANLRMLLSVFQCTSDQLSRVLQNANEVALHTVSVLAANAASLKSKGFKIRNISSILGNARASAPSAIIAITKDAQRLLDLEYTPTNISSMLNRAGGSISAIIQTIIANTKKLRGLDSVVTR